MRADWRKAAIEGDSQVIGRLLTEDVNIDGRDRYGQTALMLAAMHGQEEVVAVLLENQLARVEGVVRVGALVLGSIFVIASAVAWVAAGDVLRPLAQAEAHELAAHRFTTTLQRCRRIWRTSPPITNGMKIL